MPAWAFVYMHSAMAFSRDDVWPCFVFRRFAGIAGRPPYHSLVSRSVVLGASCRACCPISASACSAVPLS
eukprot:4385324-Alexandrium_andersonii.AAC.1